MVSKVNISLEDSLLAQVDAYADKHHLSRSAVLALSASKFLEAETKAPAARSALADMFGLLADTVSGKVPKEELQTRLDALEADYASLKG